MALTFTHPGFLRERNAGVLGDIGLYIYVDRLYPAAPFDAILDFQDAETVLKTEAVEPLAVAGFSGYLLRMRHQSTFGVRDLWVARLKGENEEFSSVLRRLALLPDIFIGVCDGCAFGGNEHCVNRLTTPGLTSSQARGISVPRWWITDHFMGATIPTSLPTGTLVTGPKGFPWSFRKLALLSTEWGNYGGWSAIGGATAFEVVPASIT